MNADGTGEVNLTNHAAIDAHPDWSPDGSQIAFVSNRTDVPTNEDGNLEVFVMNSDGTAVTQVTNTVYPFPGQSGYDHYHPSWSPEGTRLAFEWSDPSGTSQIYVINLDGTGEQRLTDPADFASKHAPDWSPVDESIAFTWGFGYLSGQDVHVVQADGTGETNLTPDTVWSDELDPAWSPDGTRLAFVTTRNPGQFGLPNEDIYVMDRDGTGLIQLTDYAGFDNEPAWSTDGTQVSFSSARGGAYDLYVVDVPPSPDGQLRLAAGLPDATTEVPPATQLTETAADEAHSAWRPSVEEPTQWTVTVSKTGRGNVASKQAGVRCGPDCQETFPAGTVLKLRARPAAGATFLGWTGECSGTNAICTLVVDGPTSVTARFSA
jgi:Tol biopolymer transport system component